MSKEKMKNKHICSECGSLAYWMYMPGGSGSIEEDVYCDECVPRGCSCNQEPFTIQSMRWHKEEGHNFKLGYWRNVSNGKTISVSPLIIPLDEKNREYPCCEYFYEKDGLDIN